MRIERTFNLAQGRFGMLQPPRTHPGQDSVAQQYRSALVQQGRTPPAPTPVEVTPVSNLPKTLVDAPRNAGPHGGTTPSAEAHSGNAK